MSAVTEVHQGETTITSSDGASGSITVGLTADITFANCSLDASTRHAGGTGARAKRQCLRLELATSGSNVVINWTRFEGSFADDLTLGWFVIEWDSDSLGTDGVERGTHTKATDDTSDTVSLTGTFAPGNSLLFVSSETTDNSYTQKSGGGASHIVSFDGTGANVVITCESNPGSGDIEVGWEAVELKSADLDAEHGESSFTDSGPQAITSVTLADSLLLCRGAWGGNVATTRWASRAEFDSATQISFDACTIGSAVASEFGWTVAEWLSDVNVDQGTHTVPANDGSENVSLGASRTRSRTAAMMGHSWWPNAYDPSTTTDSDELGDAFFSRTLDGTTTTSNVVLERYFDATSNSFEVAYNVVEFPAAAAGGSITAIKANAQASSNAAPTGTTGAQASISASSQAGATTTVAVGANAQASSLAAAFATVAVAASAQGSAQAAPTAMGSASAQAQATARPATIQGALTAIQANAQASARPAVLVQPTTRSSATSSARSFVNGFTMHTARGRVQVTGNVAGIVPPGQVDGVKANAQASARAAATTSGAAAATSSASARATAFLQVAAAAHGVATSRRAQVGDGVDALIAHAQCSTRQARLGPWELHPAELQAALDVPDFFDDAFTDQELEDDLDNMMGPL